MFNEFGWYEIWLSLATGMITSFLFLLMTFYLRPRIQISDCISKLDGIYRIKVINRSRFFKIIDVHVELSSLTYYNTPGGRNTTMENLRMGKNHIWFISSRPFREDKTASYAVLFRTVEDLESKLKNDGTLHFKVVAKHGLSGFPKVKNVEFHTSDRIKSGKFKFGNSMEIIAP